MVLDRFLKYVSFDTQSDEYSQTVPTTEKQKALAACLRDELLALGLADSRVDEWGYVYASLPATPGCEDKPTLGLIAHMDTSPAVSGKDVHPRIVHYTGGEIALSDTVRLSPDAFPCLNRYVGQDLIVTDGTTLLGADDKAGVAEIVSTVAYLLEHPEIPHPRLSVGFTPDEEVGQGADHFDVAAFAADFAYTVDGGEIGEIEYENFNAAAACITVKGINIHPGSAKNRMKNAALIAAEFIAMMPEAETPAHTEGYEGFYHLCDMTGNESEATLHYIIRDHDRTRFEERKAFVLRAADYLNAKWGAGTVTADVRDSYYNMKEKILPHMFLIDRAKDAMTAAGYTPEVVAIRGGTDGARLSFMGLPCPNLSTGGANFHAIHEFIPVPSLEGMVRVLTELIRRFAE